jgi:hypothetical protein
MKIRLLAATNRPNKNFLNIGDDIQTLAVRQHINQEFDYIDRDYLHTYDGDPCVVPLNGWFSHLPENWPPSEKIRPLFFGFHMTQRAANTYSNYINYFKKYAPIGCRDPATAAIFRSWGVDAYVSGCATMTFAHRKETPRDPKTLFVDEDMKRFTGFSQSSPIEITHKIGIYPSFETKAQLAIDLLDFYKNRAGLIVTSRIHCAMPCAAMGIPVLYSGVQEPRTKVIELIGIRSIKVSFFQKTDIRKLNIEKLNFEEKKSEIIADLRSKLQELGVITH